MAVQAFERHLTDADTPVVINGDRASWIHKGIGYLPNAIFQVDRFHLIWDINRIFCSVPRSSGQNASQWCHHHDGITMCPEHRSPWGNH